MDPITPKTAAAYIRVSDERQDEYSPDSQLKKIREYAKANGYIVPDEFVFYDDGISGKSTAKRSQFHDLIALAKDKDHPIDAILVWKFSRFARNQEESIVYKSLLAKINVSVISISEPLPDGPFGGLVERIIEWMDEYYLVRLSGEVRRGMTEKVTRGEPICAPAFGYDMRDKKYYPNDDADTVREVFASYLNGEGMRAIASRLNLRGVRTKFGNPPDNRWIEYMLNNPVYIGKIRWSTNGRGASKRDYDSPDTLIVDGHHDPIIDLETWEAAQKLLAKNKQKYTKHARREQAPSTYALRSLFRCSCCGATMVRAYTQIPSLQCHNYSRGKCVRSHSITMERAEAALVRALESAVENNSFSIAPPDFSSSPLIDQGAIQKSIAAEERRLQRAKEAYQAEIDTLEEYAQNKKRITERILELKSKLEIHQIPARSPEEYASSVKNVLTLLRDPLADEAIKNEALIDIIDKIVYHADLKVIDVFFRP